MFPEAICAFSNDFANHQQPAYLLIGVEDKTGKASGWRTCLAFAGGPGEMRTTRGIAQG